MPRALEAVLHDAAAERVDLVLFGGDLIGGPFPRRTLELARSVAARFVRGNCERLPSEWDREHLLADELRWLADLPLTASLDGVLYCHATPRDDTPITTELTPDDVLADTFGGADEPLVVIGHTHHQFDRRVGGVHVVNAGSVGMPYEDDVAAFWTLIVDGEPQFQPTDRRRQGREAARAGRRLRRRGCERRRAMVRGRCAPARRLRRGRGRRVE